MTLASWQFVCETETLSASATDSATKFKHSYRGVSDSPGGRGMRHLMLTQLHKLPVIVYIGNYIDAAIGYIVFTDIEM